MALGRDLRNAGASRGFVGGGIAPTRRTTPPAPTPRPPAPNDDILAMIDARVASFDPGARVATQQQPKEENESAWGRGLGILLNNPVTQGVLKPLEVIDYGRRAATLGAEEGSELLSGWLGMEDEFGSKFNEDGTRSEFGNQSNWDKLKDPTYGVGDLVKIGTDVLPGEWNDKWGDRIGGFIGDIALDPTSYLTAGVGGVLGKSGRAMYSSTVRATGRELAQKAALEGVEEAGQAAIRRKWDDAAAYIGRYGPGSVKDPEVLKALNLPQQGLRFGSMKGGQGLRIGGNTRVGDALGEAARKVNRGVAGVRAGFYDTAVGSTMAKWRTPDELIKAHQVIRSGKAQRGMEMGAALALTEFHRGATQGENQFRGAASRTFDQIGAKVRGQEALQATIDAESKGVRTAWNDYADELRTLAKRYGVEIPYRENFVPHILTEEAQILLRGSEDARNAFGVMVKHLDDPSGVTMARKFDGGEHIIDGVKVDLGNGTIEEANAAMKKAFGVEKFYDDNITQIYSKYVSRLSSDAGLMNGLRKAADQFPELVVASDDPAGLLRIFQDVVDEAATDLANKEALPGLRARLTKANRAVGEAEDRALRSVMDGGDILRDQAGENLSALTTMRKATKDQLAALQRTEKSAVKRRDKIVNALQGEVNDMEARREVLRGEVATLRQQERAAMDAVEGAVNSADRRSRSASRASRIRNARVAKEGELELIEQEQDLLNEINQKIKYAQVKESIVTGRLGSEGVTPRMAPDTVNVQGARPSTELTAAGFNQPIGESFEALAAGKRIEDDGFVTVGPAQQLYNEMVDSGKLEGMDPFTRNRIVGDATRERAANLNSARQIDHGFKPEQLPGLPSADEVVRKYEGLRTQAREGYDRAQAARQPAAPVDTSLSRGERQRLQRATARQERMRTQLSDLLASDTGKQWMDDWNQIEDVGHLNNPALWGQRQESLRGQLQIELDTAKTRAAAIDEARHDPRVSGRPRNVGAIRDLQAQIRERQGQIAAIEEKVNKALQGEGFGPTKRVVQESPPVKYEAAQFERDVPASRSTRGVIDQEMERGRRLAGELQEMERRLADMMDVEGTTVSARNKGAVKTQRTAAQQRVKKLEAQVNAIKRKGQKTRDKVAKLEEGIAEAKSTAKQLTEKTQARPQSATPQRIDNIDEVIRRIDADEDEALRRLERRQGEALLVPNRELDTRGRGTTHTRMPNRSKVEEDIAKLEATRGRLKLPEAGTEARKALDNEARAFPMPDNTASPRSRSTNILESSNLVAPYRATLLEAGAITEAEGMRHVTQEFRLRAAINAHDKSPNVVTLQNMTNAADELRRTNEFLAKYAKVVAAGEAPSDGLANRITRDIIDLDIAMYRDEIERLKSGRGKYIDREAEDLSEAMTRAIIDLDNAYSDKQAANTIFRSKSLSADEQIALNETWIEGLKFSIEDGKRRLQNSRRRRNAAVKRGDEKAAANAERAMKDNAASIESSQAGLARTEARLVELRGYSMAPDLKQIKVTLEGLAESTMSDEAALVLGKVLSGEDVNALRKFAQYGGISRTDAEQELRDFIRDLLERQGLDAGDAQLENNPLAALELATRFQATVEYDRAKALFAETFGDLGFKRQDDLGMERTVGYVAGRKGGKYFDEGVLKRVIKNRLEKERGMSEVDYALRDLESRRNRLNTIRRGLGGESKGMGADIVGVTPEGEYLRGAQGVGLPEIDSGMEAALKGDMLPAERTKAVARAQRLEPLSDIRDSRIAAQEQARSQGSFQGLPFANWREMIFGEGAQMRPTMKISRPQGEQAARGLKGASVDIPHPSTAITRDSAAVEGRVLADQLGQLDATQADLQDIIARSQRVQDMGGQLAAPIEQSVAARQGRIANELDPVLAEAGTPMFPEVDEAGARIQQGFDEQLGPRQEQIGQLDTEIAARNKAMDRVVQEAAPEIATTRNGIREVEEILHGQTAPIREMPPIGGYTDPQQLTLDGSLPQRAQDLDRLALPAAGESSASKSFDARIAEAKEISSKVTKQSTSLGYNEKGLEYIARDFDRSMAEMGLPQAETMLVRSLLADATGAEAEAALLKKGADALESAIAKAEINKLKVVSESALLASFKPMAEVLTKGSDEGVNFFMEQSLAQYFTRIDEGIKTNRFWKAVEAYTRFFKTYATARPDFHVRNGVSAMFMNTTDGVPIGYNFSALKVWKAMASSEEDFVAGLRKAATESSGYSGLTNGQLADAIEAAWASGAGGQFAERGVGGTSNRRIINNTWTRTSKKVGEFVEGPVRLAVAMDSIKNGRSVDEAYERIARIHFDYSDVSRFDQYAKRMIPFWTFMSRNLPLQLTQMWTKPRTYQHYNSFVRNFRQEADPLAPEYWATSGGFPIMQGENGTEDQTWLMPDLAHNRVTGDVKTALGLASLTDPSGLTSASPLFITPAELATGQDFFTGRQYDDADVLKLGGLEKVLQPFTDAAGLSQDGVMNEQVLRSMRGLVPFWDQAARVAPGVVTGDASEVDKERQAQTILRYLGVFPGRTLTPGVREQTARNQYYDQMDEARKQQAYESALSGG